MNKSFSDGISLNFLQKISLEPCTLKCYPINNIPATPLSLQANAHFGRVFLIKKQLALVAKNPYTNNNSTRHASSRKATHKSAGLFLWGLINI